MTTREKTIFEALDLAEATILRLTCRDTAKRDSVQGSLAVIRDALNHVPEDTGMTTTELQDLRLYRRYIEDNLDRIARDGWVPVCFEEFRTSEDCTGYAAQTLTKGD